MKKIISLVLSFSLIFGSVTPSYAQKGKVVKQIGKAFSPEVITKNLTKVNGLSGMLRQAPSALAATEIANNVARVYETQMAVITTPKSFSDIS